jgi:hypothetical protein
MLRLPIQELVKKCGRELTKPKPTTQIHFVDFDKLRQYKPQAFGGRVQLEMKEVKNKIDFTDELFKRKKNI